jgi:hypothetical protein
MQTTRYSRQILVELNTLSTDFRSKLRYQVSSKPVQWEPSWSMWTNGRTDMTVLTVAFRNFSNAPKMQSCTPPPPHAHTRARARRVDLGYNDIPLGDT